MLKAPAVGKSVILFNGIDLVITTRVPSESPVIAEFNVIVPVVPLPPAIEYAVVIVPSIKTVKSVAS